MTDVPERAATPQDPNDIFEQRLLGLLQRLDALAGALNPEYAEEIGDGLHAEDGCNGVISTTDLGDTLRTELCFNAVRVREQLGGVVCSELFPGKEIAARFILRGTITQDLAGIAAFPDEIQREARASDHFHEELANASTKYGIMLEQEFTLATDGEFERKLYLGYLIDDVMFSHNDLLEVHDDPDAVADIALPNDDQDSVSGTFLLSGLEGVFSDGELADLRSRSDSLIQQSAGRRECEHMRNEAAALRFVGRVQQLDMVAKMIAQFDGTAAAA